MLVEFLQTQPTVITNHGATSIGLSVFTSSAVSVWLMQWLKNSKWFPLLKEGQAALNRTAAVVVAFLSSLGVHFVWDGTAHTLLITGLTLSGIGAMAWHFINQMAAQETIYQMSVNKPGAPPTGFHNAVVPGEEPPPLIPPAPAKDAPKAA
jgi:hypothetical protein